MSERTKKILLGLGLVVVSVGIALALYYTFFKPAGPSEGELTTEEETAGGLPTSGLGTPTTIGQVEEIGLQVSEVARGGLTEVTSLTTGRVYSTSVNPDGESMNYYDASDDRFYQINADGTVTRLSDQKFPDVDDVSWADQGDKAVIEFPDGSNIVYNFESETQVTLPNHWDDFEFSPSGTEIITKSMTTDPDSRWLIITSEDGTHTTGVNPLGSNADKVYLNWSPNQQILAFSDTGPTQTGFDRKMILPVTENMDVLPGLIVEGFGFESVWSPRGDRILYSVSGEENDFKPMLWVVDGSINSIGDNRHRLDVETWANRCVFQDNESVICAVPQDMPNNAGIQPGIISASEASDYLYEININSGAKSLLAVPEEAQGIENLTLSADGNTLFFTDARSGILQMIKLK
ncbi:MAG: hypothetical protein V1695_00185 [Candidatus Uhrbacteria bacterium]